MNEWVMVKHLLSDYAENHPDLDTAMAYAPSNIALVKYWGKRDEALKLPVTSSLSISLNDKGAQTTLRLCAGDSDQVVLNGQPVSKSTSFYRRIEKFLNLFRHQNQHYSVDTRLNIPSAAGLASSACGFAALTLALNELHQWHLNRKQLSILARLGSGSAARSLWHGFVEWHKGIRDDGMDCFAEPLDVTWPELRVGLLIVNEQEKPIGSTQAMKTTQETSPLYSSWPDTVAADLQAIKPAVVQCDLNTMGRIAESNAVAMHKTMQAAVPPIDYLQCETKQAIGTVHELRRQGYAVYFTQDAGPNIKLLFESSSQSMVESVFPNVNIVTPFS